jgi:hypothetical protein
MAWHKHAKMSSSHAWLGSWSSISMLGCATASELRPTVSWTQRAAARRAAARVPPEEPQVQSAAAAGELSLPVCRGRVDAAAAAAEERLHR